MVFCEVCDSRLVRSTCPKCSSIPIGLPKITLNIKKKEQKEEEVYFNCKKEEVNMPCKKKCGSNRVYITKHQLRAGDEAETLIITCIKCKAVWRI